MNNKKHPYAFLSSRIKIMIGCMLYAFCLHTAATDDIKKLADSCTACHGVNGVSQNTQWPNLAGQKAGYMITELKAFRRRLRHNELMSPIAKTLSDQQIAALANYYASQSAATAKKKVLQVNQNGKNIRSYCLPCHGMNGITVNEQWPNLAGQQKQYLIKQLMAFRHDRRNGPNMQVIAKELSEEQIRAVAEYYSQLSVD